MIAEELIVKIRAEARQAVKEIGDVSKQTDKAENSTRKLITTMAKSAAGFAAAALSVRALAGAVKESVKLAGIQEQAERGLEAALIGVGDASGEGAEMLKRYASELQGVTTFGDEATISAAALFTQLTGMTAEMTKEALPAIQDFASAMGMDLNGAAQIIGKSIGSSTNALTRYGIEIDNSLEGTERMNAVVGQLNEKFGGFSEAVADTASGSLIQLQNAMGDFKEIGGEAITSFLEPATTALTNYITRLNDTIRAKQTLNELEGVNTITALEQQIAARGTLLDRASEEFQAAQSNTREAQAALDTMREQGIASVDMIKRQEEAVEVRQDEQRAAHQVVREEQNAQRALKERLATLRETLSATGDMTQPMGDLIDTGAAGDAGEDAGEAAAEGFYRAMDEATRGARSRMGPLLPVDTIVMENEAAANEVENNWKGAFTAIASSALQTWSMINAAMAQNTANQKRQIDKQLEYLSDRHDRELAWAEAAGASDEEIANMRAAHLEAEQEAERKAEKEKAKLAKQQFQREKALKIAQTIQATALAVMQALAQLGPIAGAIAASSISAMGATQLGIIAAQEPPKFERGGSFVTDGPQMIEVGDGQSPRERVTVEPLTGPYARSGGGNNINVNINGVIDEEMAIKIKDQIQRAEMRGAA